MTVYVTPAEALATWGVSPNRIKLWHHRGRLTACWYEGRSPVFELDPVLRLNRLASLHPRAKR